MVLGAQEPIVRRKLSDEVFDRLKAMIVSGERGPGETLPSERELMARFGVGRPAIREAMQALANLGLVTIHHGERARVQELQLALKRKRDSEMDVDNGGGGGGNSTGGGWTGTGAMSTTCGSTGG